MSDLTVENMFSDKSVHCRSVIPRMALGALDRKRILEHVISDVTSQILSMPGSNPIGLTITVSTMEILGEVALVVEGSAPEYDLSEDFFTKA